MCLVDSSQKIVVDTFLRKKSVKVCIAKNCSVVSNDVHQVLQIFLLIDLTAWING